MTYAVFTHNDHYLFTIVADNEPHAKSQLRMFVSGMNKEFGNGKFCVDKFILVLQ